MGLLNTKPHSQLKMEEEKLEPVQDALKKVIKKSMAADGLVKGLNQVGKALDRKDAYLCVLADDCDDPKYKKLITALAKQNKIPLMNIPKRQDLGEWVGQCKYDKENGKARKVRGCSSIAIKDYGEVSDALTVIEQYIKEHNL